jgi:aldehyde dehydrogenase (NAD+)
MLEFTSVLEEAGVPPGVVNVITGVGERAGAALVRHFGIDLITFTGGTETGRFIAREAARRPVRVVLELGGKSPNIVFSDANLDNAVSGIVAGIFAACGQTCVAGSRCFVHEDVYDEVLLAVEARTRAIRLGDPVNEETDVGPVAFEEQMEKVLSYVAAGIRDGAAVLAGGKRSSRPGLESGFFVEPTILDNVENRMRVVREEIFGPVLCMIRFRGEDEVVVLANDSPYGLAAGVWTGDISRAHRIAQRLDAGTVWLNTYRALSPLSPFGGFKESGYGKESGKEAMLEYTRLKSVWLSIAEGPAPDPFVMRL